MIETVYRPDASIAAKLRRRAVRLYRRRRIRRRTDRPMVTFTFDDVPLSAAETGAAVLEALDLRATFFVSGGLAGAEGALGRLAPPEVIRRLARTGHEIGCHTFSHMDCGGADEDSVSEDLERNRRAFLSWGLPTPKTFAYPFGEVAAPVKRLACDAFALARGVHRGNLGPGSDLIQAPAVSFEGPDGEARAEHWMSRTVATGRWLILMGHAVEASPGEFSVTAQTLHRLAASARARGFEVVTALQGVQKTGAGRP